MNLGSLPSIEISEEPFWLLCAYKNLIFHSIFRIIKDQRTFITCHSKRMIFIGETHDVFIMALIPFLNSILIRAVSKISF